MVKSIFLQDGEEIFVDDEDYERVNKHFWRKHGKHESSYATTINQKVITLRAFLFGEEEMTQIIKGNDFTKNNIIKEPRTKHTRKISDKSSKYKGVSWRKREKKWGVSIYVDGKNKWLGDFYSEIEAAKAYNKGVDDFWGGVGLKNVIGNTPISKYREEEKDRTRYRPRGRTGVLGYRGVSKTRKGSDRKRVRVNYHGKNIVVISGRISNDKAALIFNKVAIFLFGDKAYLNNVPMTDELKEFIDNWEIPNKIKELKK